MTNPIVTIGLPVYNGENFVQAAISSILAQDFSDFELIISDNSSTDKTSAICLKAAEVDSRIIYIRQPHNIGAIQNFNIVFEMARGKYFKWAAHDDLLGPGFISACVTALDADPDLILAYPSTVLIDASGNTTGCYIDRLDSIDKCPATRFAQWLKWGNHFCNPIFGLMVVRKLANIRPMGNFAGSDHVFLAEVALQGHCKRLPVGDMFRRVHSGMSSQAEQGSLSIVGWMSGRSARGVRFRWWRLFGEYAAAVSRSRMTVVEKLKALLALARWAIRFSPKLLKELLLPLYINGSPTRLNIWLRNMLGIEALKRRRRARR
jgi:hypothetical protein